MITVAEEKALADRFNFGVEKLKGLLVGELNSAVFKTANTIEHLIGSLQMQTYAAVLELVEWRVISLVNREQLALQSLQFVFGLRRAAQQSGEFAFNLVQIGGSALNVFLGLEQANFLLLVVSLNCLGQRVFPVFKHLNQHLKLLLELTKCAFPLTIELLFDLLQFLSKNVCFANTCFELFL